MHDDTRRAMAFRRIENRRVRTSNEKEPSFDIEYR